MFSKILESIGFMDLMKMKMELFMQQQIKVFLREIQMEPIGFDPIPLEI